MKISPSILSGALLPLAAMWVVSAVVLPVFGGAGADERVPGFWLAMFYVGGPLSIFMAAMLIMVRRRDRTLFEKLDWVALIFAAIGALAYAGIVLSMYLEAQRLAVGI